MAESDQVKAHIDQGMAAIRRGETDLAIQEWSRAIELDPANAMALTNRGTARGSKDDLSGALADFSAALEANPTYVDAFLNRANLYERQGKITEAIADLDRLIELVPTDADAYFNRANIHSHARLKLPAFFTRSADIGNYDRVMRDYDTAIELAPDRPAFYANRAGLKLEKIKQARAVQANVVSNPNLPEMFKQQAKESVAAAKGLEKSLLDDIGKAIELDGGNPGYWGNRGYFKMMMLNDIEGGVADFSRALQIEPKFLSALIFRCNGYNKLGRYHEAIQDATLAISLQPQNHELYFNRGVAYRSSGDQAAAIRDFDEVIKRDPKNVKAYANRAEAHTALNNKQEAIADWEMYLSLGGGRMFKDEAAVNEKIKKLRPRWPFGR